jgi:hypothetical protein
VFVAEPNASFNGISGREPVTISTPPRLAEELPDHTREALDAFVREYARFGRRHGVTTWLAYLPAKETVLRDLIELGPEPPDGWRSSVQTDLPNDLARRSAASGVRFLDLTPVLIAETRARRRLLFNGLYDTHLNREGAEVVARALADSETGIAARNRRAGQNGLRRRRAPRGR